jgi:hypothetical protein
MEDKSMSTAYQDVKILTVASCSFVRDEHRSHVVVSGSYGGRYNAFNAAKWGVRGVIMNDAGIGKDNAGIRGLDYLDQITLAAATADAQTCHIGDGDHMLEHGIISHVNRAATALGCSPGQNVRECAELMRSAIVPVTAPPSIIEGARFVMRDVPGEPMIICADSVGCYNPKMRVGSPSPRRTAPSPGDDRTMQFLQTSTPCSSVMPAAAWMELASRGWLISTKKGSSRARPPQRVLRSAIHARSTKTVSCRTSTAQQPGSAVGLACR